MMKCRVSCVRCQDAAAARGRGGAYRRGFTLVELIISIAVFGVLVSIAMGGLATAMRTQRQTTALIMVNSNIPFALEQMAREMRTGNGFYCTATGAGAPCPAGGSGDVVFTNARGDLVEYAYDAANKVITRSEGGGAPVDITSRNVEVQYFVFHVLGNEAFPDEYPARVTMVVGAAPRETTIAGNVVRFQTSVSARFDG
jgi:prepilin-type N-terminal cleavage/methylation domain-containing protein